MNGGKLNERNIGSISKYKGPNIVEGSPTTNKFQMKYPEPNAKSRELHLAKRDTNQINECRELAESATAEAESMLSAGKKTVKDLTLRIEETNLRAKAQMAKRREEECNSENMECAKVLRDLEIIKRELLKLKLDMASILEEKRRAEKQMESSLSKTQSYSISIEALTKEVEEVNEEHVLVELARIEAVKEYREIEAQRRCNAEEYYTAVEETQIEKQNFIQEIKNGKDMDRKLAITMSDMNMLESKLKEMQKGQSKELESAPLLESVMKELENLNKELISVKEECFQFLTSINFIQNEIRHVTEEKARINMKEEKADIVTESLNSKLLTAISDMEATSTVQDKAKSVYSNLSLSLKQLKSEAETAKTERTLIRKETATMKAETQRAEAETDSADEILQITMQDLKIIKSSEEKALQNLEVVVENTVRNRAFVFQRNSRITISKFEYEYLMGHAAKAKDIADKKVAAAQAWIEALKASETESLIKTKILQRETLLPNAEVPKITSMIIVEKEQRLEKTETSMRAKEMVESDFDKWRKKTEPETLKPEIGLSSKVMNKSVKNTSARRAKVRKSARSMSLIQKEKKTYAKHSPLLQ